MFNWGLSFPIRRNRREVGVFFHIFSRFMMFLLDSILKLLPGKVLD